MLQFGVNRIPNFTTSSSSSSWIPHSRSHSLSPPPTKLLAAQSSRIKMAQTIEHIVLFKVKPNTEPSKITTMVNGLNGLSSLDQVLHLSTGPIHRTQSTSPSLTFTHMLHSRYKTKDDLGAYLEHPAHTGLVAESVDPICDDVMLVDWVAHLGESGVVLPPGAVMRVSFLKLKEGLGESEREEVLRVFGGNTSFGENFSPVKTNGFTIASLAVLAGVEELEALDCNEEKVKKFLEDSIIVDYVVG